MIDTTDTKMVWRKRQLDPPDRSHPTSHRPTSAFVRSHIPQLTEIKMFQVVNFKVYKR